MLTRRWLVTAVAIVALAGCGAEAEPTDVPVPAPSAPSPAGSSTAGPSAAASAAGPGGDGTSAAGGAATRTDSASGGTGAFVSVVRDRLPDIAADRRDGEIGDIARQACAALSGGATADRIVADTRALGTLDATATDPATARELVKLAIDTVCPGQAGRVDEF